MTGAVTASVRYGGYAELARRLSDAGPRQVSRQGVRAWWLSRSRNKFPHPHHRDEDGFKQWDISEVLDWYARYRPPPTSHWGSGGGRRKEGR
jgi:hypothetical protein